MRDHYLPSCMTSIHDGVPAGQTFIVRLNDNYHDGVIEADRAILRAKMGVLKVNAASNTLSPNMKYWRITAV